MICSRFIREYGVATPLKAAVVFLAIPLALLIGLAVKAVDLFLFLCQVQNLNRAKFPQVGDAPANR